MKEELIRVENGHFLNDGNDYQLDIFIARGECIGVYVDEHLTSGTAYLDIFKGYSHMQGGTAFCEGRRRRSDRASALDHAAQHGGGQKPL